jgi:putative cardiolipin synthase
MQRRLIALVVFLFLVPSACRTLPSNPPRTESYARVPSHETRLADLTRAIASRHDADASAFLPLDRAQDALQYRLMLADVAEQSLDMQYFIWHADDAGLIMMDRVFHAADRGVRVRLLIDDLVLMGLDEGGAAIDDHPNIEFRIYNPFKSRDGGWLRRAMEGAFDFDRVNHRMHNKLMVADNHVAILGGRNIGDEYFGLHHAYNFRDFDVIVAGAVVTDLSDSFDRYWNSPLAYPGSAIPRGPGSLTLDQMRQDGVVRLAEATQRLQSFPLEPSDWTDTLDHLAGRMTAGTARVVYDTPREDSTVKPVEVMNSIATLAAAATDEIIVSAAYLIPTGDSVDELRAIVDRGVRVRILTNSLVTNDSTIAQRAYGNYRRAMLEAGVELFELRGDAADKSISDTPPVTSEMLALHSKLIVVDRRKTYVGSLNLDPRSAINTELGLVITDPAFANKVADILERDMSYDNAWTVRLTERGHIEWESGLGKRNQSPARNDFQRLGGMFAGMLEEQL